MMPIASTSSVSYDDHIMRSAKSKLHVNAPVGIEQSAIPTRGRDFPAVTDEDVALSKVCFGLDLMTSESGFLMLFFLATLD